MAEHRDPLLTKAAATATYVPKWKPNTAYLAGDPVVNPSGQLVTALTGFTSGSSFDAANWSTPDLTTATGVSVALALVL